MCLCVGVSKVGVVSCEPTGKASIADRLRTMNREKLSCAAAAIAAPVLQTPLKVYMSQPMNS